MVWAVLYSTEEERFVLRQERVYLNSTPVRHKRDNVNINIWSFSKYPIPTHGHVICIHMLISPKKRPFVTNSGKTAVAWRYYAVGLS